MEEGPRRLNVPTGLVTVVGPRPDGSLEGDLSLPSAPPVSLLGADSEPSVVQVAAPESALPIDAAASVAAFLWSLEDRRGPVTITVTGPVTLALALRAAGSDLETAARIAVDRVVDAVDALTRMVLDLAPRAVPVVVLDDPDLGRSMHPTFAYLPDEIGWMLSEVVDRLRASSPDASVGVAVSGRVDWSLVMACGVDLIALPVGSPMAPFADQLARFLADGGVVAWGAVPVDEPVGDRSDRWWARLSEVWCELTRLGVDALSLRERSVITPAGSLDRCTHAQAEHLIALCQELATRVRHQAIGVRLSIGA